MFRSRYRDESGVLKTMDNCNNNQLSYDSANGKVDVIISSIFSHFPNIEEIVTILTIREKRHAYYSGSSRIMINTATFPLLLRQWRVRRSQVSI